MQIRKCAVIVSALSLLISGTAFASFRVAWFASEGFYNNGGVGSIIADGSGGSVLAQLIYSPDGVINDANFATANYVTGDDVLLQQYVYTEDGVGGNGDQWADFAAQSYTGAYSAGNFYCRIFEGTAITNDMYYYAGHLLAAVDLEPPPAPTPQSYDLNLNLPYGNPLNRQVIPEPSTMIFAIIGCLAVFIKRVRQRMKS